MNIPYATVHHPWGLVGGYPGAHQHRLMASNGVKGQRRAAAVGIDNLAKRNQPQLNQRLEAIADAAHQTVAVLKQLVYPLFNLWIAEKSSDKFAGTFRLIAAGETSWNGNNSGFWQSLSEMPARFLDILRRQIANNKDLCLRTGSVKGPSRIVFAVGARGTPESAHAA